MRNKEFSKSTHSVDEGRRGSQDIWVSGKFGVRTYVWYITYFLGKATVFAFLPFFGRKFTHSVDERRRGGHDIGLGLGIYI